MPRPKRKTTGRRRKPKQTRVRRPVRVDVTRPDGKIEIISKRPPYRTRLEVVDRDGELGVISKRPKK